MPRPVGRLENWPLFRAVGPAAVSSSVPDWLHQETKFKARTPKRSRFPATGDQNGFVT